MTGRDSDPPGDTPTDLPPLSENAVKVREILLGLPPDQALTGPKLLDVLATQDVFIDQGTLTKRIIPELKPYGVQNKPRVGYYIPASKRPTQ